MRAMDDISSAQGTRMAQKVIDIVGASKEALLKQPKTLWPKQLRLFRYEVGRAWRISKSIDGKKITEYA